MELLRVPPQLDHSYFFSRQVMEWEETYSMVFHPDKPFIYDAAFHNGRKSLRPWEDPESAIPLLLNQWNSLKEDLVQSFAKRDRLNTVESMKSAIALFIEILYWTNGLPVSFPLDKIDQLKSVPINIRDRLTFIMARPNHHLSFKQLAELMIEQEKQFVKTIVLKNTIKKVQE